MEFFNYLNYSLGNEHWATEAQALRVKPGDNVVCVTASGDRPLHLLMTDCAEIISVDMNRIQNYLLDLKIAAIAMLDYDQYLAFLGFEPTPHRYSIFKSLKSQMSPDAFNFWEKHPKMITPGIIYQGRIERFTANASKIFKLLRHRKIKKLLSFDDLDKQREFVQQNWDTAFWRMLFSTFGNPKFSRYFLNDPGLNSYTEYSNNPGNYINARMIRYLHHHLARDSALMQLTFTGKINQHAYFPYLTEAGYKKIRSNMGRLHYRTCSVVDYLNQERKNDIDCFSLSDIASYMPQVTFERLLTGIQLSAKPNARFCLREFMSKRYIPAESSHIFRREIELENQLEIEETNFVYRFIIGTIQK